MTGSIAASGDVTSLLNGVGGDYDLSDTSSGKDYNNCFDSLFDGCSSLTKAPKLPSTKLSSGCYCLMFYLCTSLTTAPALPATTLTNYCYLCMFSRCTSLTTPPALPATTLATKCYEEMFVACTSLIVSDNSGTGYDKEWRIPTSGEFTSSNEQSYMFNPYIDAGVPGTRTSNNMAGAQGQSYTYYTQNTPVSASAN